MERVVTREILHDIPVPLALPSWYKTGRPKDYTWRPVNHGELADALVTAIEGQNIRVTNEQYTLFRNDQALMARIFIEPTHDVDPSWQNALQASAKFRDHGMKMFISMRHSNDGAYGISVVAGAMVLVCSNGMMRERFGRIKVNQKHSQDLPIDQYIASAVQEVVLDFDVIERQKRLMESREIHEDFGCRLIFEARQENIVDDKTGFVTADEWMHPKYEVFQPRNAWSLYNAFTAAAQTIKDPADQVNLLADANGFILNRTSPINA